MVPIYMLTHECQSKDTTKDRPWGSLKDDADKRALCRISKAGRRQLYGYCITAPVTGEIGQIHQKFSLFSAILHNESTTTRGQGCTSHKVKREYVKTSHIGCFASFSLYHLNWLWSSAGSIQGVHVDLELQRPWFRSEKRRPRKTVDSSLLRRFKGILVRPNRHNIFTNIIKRM